ncbi:phytanoyl-CoA dioxygenase family protein [Vibrio lentus]|nr:phytanoyl-CoA dioxygenase family protein [Vibrio lentus]
MFQQLSDRYDEHGCIVIRNYFDEAQIARLEKSKLKFHESWKADNEEFYQEEVHLTPSLITGSEYLPADDRTVLFDFISSKVMEVVDAVIPNKPAFMNTQLFFNPVNPQQRFWHRDCQYDHEMMTRQSIRETQVLHLRVPIFDEPGMELYLPEHTNAGTMKKNTTFAKKNGKASSDDICGKQILLDAGDLLVFSADMIHRGRYTGLIVGLGYF